MQPSHVRIKKKSLFFIASIGILLLVLIFLPKKTSTLFLQLSSSTVSIGKTIKATVIVKPETTHVVQVAMLNLTYDQQLLEFVGCSQGKDFEAIVSDVDPCSVDASTPGTLHIDIENKEDVLTTGDVPLAHVTFRGKKTGTSSLIFTKIDVVAENNEAPLDLTLTPQVSKIVVTN